MTFEPYIRHIDKADRINTKIVDSSAPITEEMVREGMKKRGLLPMTPSEYFLVQAERGRASFERAANKMFMRVWCRRRQQRIIKHGRCGRFDRRAK